VGPFQVVAALALATAAGLGQAAGCPISDDGGSPLRRTILRVKYLAETEAWEREATKRSAVQYVLLVDAPLRRGDECYWPVEARAGSELWHRFYVTARGERVLVEVADGKLVTLEAWRAARR